MNTGFSDILQEVGATKSPRIRWAILGGGDILGIKNYGVVGDSLSENKWDRICSITATVHPLPKTAQAWL